jgi:acyl carrier protein
MKNMDTKIIEIINNICDFQIDNNSNLESIFDELDSIQFFNLILRIEKEFNLSISYADISRLHNISDISKFIIKSVKK